MPRLLALLVLLPSLAGANDVTERAEALHQKALAAVRVGRVEQAAGLWDQAIALDKHWKYAFNQATCYGHLKRWAPAWQAARAAFDYGVPEEHRAEVTRVEADAEERLLKQHARLELTVEPKDADVRLDGEPWPAPRVRMLGRVRSTVVVSRAGHVAQTLVLEHPIGARIARTVTLSPVPSEGALLVRGSPVGATVTVGGAPIGRLPEARQGSLRPGAFTVRVEAPGHATHEERVEVRPGATATCTVALRALPAVAVTPLSPSLVGWKWAATGAGALLLAVGGGLFGHAARLANDADALSPNAPGYDGDYDRARSRFDATIASAATLVALGSAAAVAAIVLHALDGKRGTAHRVDAVIDAVIGPGGALVRVGF